MPAAHHRLRRSHFDALVSGRGDNQAVHALLRVERSWRLGLLRLVLDAARADPALCGPLSPVDDVWNLLTTAERRSASAVADVLRHPSVGSWATHVLRRLQQDAGSPSPLWAEVGYLHSLAASAAIRAGLDFTLAVPVTAGYVVLPTLGCAQLRPGTDAGTATVQVSGKVATITAGPTVVRIHSAQDSDWVPVPRLRALEGEHLLAVRLDSLDPYRTFREPRAPEPLPAEHIRHWRDQLAEAWQLLVRACPTLATPLSMSVSTLVPLPNQHRFRVTSASAGDAFGAMMMSQPQEPVELAVTLVHEFQHMKLGALLHLVPMHDREPAQRLYAPWRDDPRPLAGLLQGVYAFTGVAEFWRSAQQHLTGGTRRLAEFEFVRWQRQVRTVLEQLDELPELTGVGRQLIASLSRTATVWSSDLVATEISAAADAATTDHWLRWRLHHLEPDPDTVTTLATAWHTGDPPPGPITQPQVRADPSATALGTLAVQSLWRLVDPAGFAALRADPDSAQTAVPGATDIGLALAAGDHAAAFQLCMDTIAVDHERTDAWAALGPAAVAQGCHTAARVLRRQPELVRAVHRRVQELSRSPVSPTAIAEWLGRTLTTGRDPDPRRLGA